MKNGNLPFLQRLLEREHYRLHSHYPGLPAIAPAVQAELFYGVETAIPAFSFRDQRNQRIVSMLDPDAVGAVERRLGETRDEALLSGGSVYASSFHGGSDEAYFCPSAAARGPALRAANPLALVFLLLGNLYGLLRAAAALLVEFGLALIDRARGGTHRQGMLRTFKLASARVAVCILMRELCVIGAKLDINRGLPVVFVNFRGYAEQARHRGPASTLAHWTLKGIDGAMARLWRAANHSPRRIYDVWIFSDHGLIGSQPYERLYHKSIDRAVAGSLQKLDGDKGEGNFSVVASGSAGFVYASGSLDDAALEFVAHDLAAAQGVPLVIARNGAGQLRAWAGDDEFRLPRQLAELVGGDHPFLHELGEDLARLCRHADAGEIAIFGWREGVAATTFGVDNGSQAGLSFQETGAFALLPADVSLPAKGQDLLRPGDLRRAALLHLGRIGIEPGRARVRRGPASTDRLRVMTYNVHGCLGMDGKLSVERIARVIARYRPDVVALQELDVGRERSGGVDQAELIARYLEMEFQFHPTLQIEEERYGDAILTHLPMRLVRAAALPGLADASGREPRGALWVTIELLDNEIQLINTHLGLDARERALQAAALCGSEWLGSENCRSPVILCGDLNASPASATCRLLRTRLDDAQARAPRHRPRNTFASRLPAVRIDHILIDPKLGVSSVEVPRSQLVQVASDHLPLIADLLVAQ